MNKARRHELKMLKYKRRLRNYRIKETPKSNLYAFRSHGKPCSCSACQQPENEYNRAKEKSFMIKARITSIEHVTPRFNIDEEFFDEIEEV